MQRYVNRILYAALAMMIVVSAFTNGSAQTRKNFLQPGEQLTYKVKFGFVKLGTVVIQTGPIANGMVTAHLHFWTAAVPFLSAKTTDNETYYADDLSLHTLEEHATNGNDKSFIASTYDRATKTLHYADEKTKSKVTQNVEPYDDALGVLLNMRAWSGAAGHKYIFLIHTTTGVKPVTVDFSDQLTDETVPAYSKKVHTRVLHGTMDLGSSAPLGANGSFSAHVTNDAAAVPVRIDMKIAIGSISLVLDNIKHTGQRLEIDARISKQRNNCSFEIKILMFTKAPNVSTFALSRTMRTDISSRIATHAASSTLRSAVCGRPVCSFLLA